MSTPKIPLSLVKVASACTASWEQMTGTDTARFCGQCSQHVYNLSDMTEETAQALIQETEGRLCVRFYQRADGTMMTKDCPVGLAALRRRVALIAGAGAAVVVAAFSMLTLGVFAGSIRGNENGGARFVNPVQRVRDWLFPPPQPPCVMGMIVPVIPAPPAPQELPQPDEVKE